LVVEIACRYADKNLEDFVKLKQLDRRSILTRSGLAILGAGLFTRAAPQSNSKKAPAAQPPAKAAAPLGKTEDCNCSRAVDGSPLDTGMSEVRPVIERYLVELRDVQRVYAVPGSPLRQSKLEGFYGDQLRLLDGIAFDALSQSGKVDYLLLRSRLERERKQLTTDARLDAEILPLVPFQEAIGGLEEARRRMETIDPQRSATTLNKIGSDAAKLKANPPQAPPAALRQPRMSVPPGMLRSPAPLTRA
jgi:hypothetical protein